MGKRTYIRHTWKGKATLTTGNSRMNTLKKNELSGYKVEDKIREEFPTATKTPTGYPYEFSNFSYLVEVKSCGEKQWMQLSSVLS